MRRLRQVPSKANTPLPQPHQPSLQASLRPRSSTTSSGDSQSLFQHSTETVRGSRIRDASCPTSGSTATLGPCRPLRLAALRPPFVAEWSFQRRQGTQQQLLKLHHLWSDMGACLSSLAGSQGPSRASAEGTTRRTDQQVQGTQPGESAYKAGDRVARLFLDAKRNLRLSLGELCAAIGRVGEEGYMEEM